MARRSKDRETKELFIKEDEQLVFVDKTLEQELREDDEVDCLGETFRSDDARRTHYLELLAEKLKDPEFRATSGFPKAEDEDILRLSDPPYYTACPNPFLEEFVGFHGTGFDPTEEYHREPFAVDVSEGKTDPLYKAHGYHTKVPHLAIMPSILHYTDPGDIVLDGFAGSGMTGVAAQWCGTAPADYKEKLAGEWKNQGHAPPKWGARHAVLGDLGPAATFIAANYNIPFDVDEFAEAAQRILDGVEDELGWMYETRHTDGSVGRINYTVWSEVFSCPECAGEIVYTKAALDPETKRIRRQIHCPHCGSEVKKTAMERLTVSRIDQARGQSFVAPRRAPVLIEYTIEGKKHTKTPDGDDVALIGRIEEAPVPDGLPVDRMMHAPDGEAWGDEWRAGVASFTHVHHLFLPRAARALATVWARAVGWRGARTRNMLLFFVEQAIWGMSLMSRYAPTHFSQVNRYMAGRLRVLSQHAECSPWYILSGKLRRLLGAFTPMPNLKSCCAVHTGSCARMMLGDDSVDYVFTDPPFADNLAYAELNFINETFLRVFTDMSPEAIVSKSQRKALSEYQRLMRSCFEEYRRVLKPGRWMTVVFSNSKNAVWRAIQEALGAAGFIVADVRTLDKQQHSFNQVAGVSVKQDLIISAYKPSASLQSQFELGQSSADGAWAFVVEHLSNVPLFVGRGDELESVAERTPQLLLDRMIAFHVQRGMAVPMNSADFFEGLSERYPLRDGMYFLPEQVAEYDRKRARAEKLRQLELFVNDEASAIQWVRQQLGPKPRSFQDLQPQFMRELQAWAEHEQTVELREILEQNFLLYQGNGPVPSQIHSYLSTQFKTLRGLEKHDPGLASKASGRWYVPDPGKAGDLEKLRARDLLKEFETFKNAKKRPKRFRTEALRAGFKAAYDDQDYDTIVAAAERIPNEMLQEDEKLLMYYDVALMRRG